MMTQADRDRLVAIKKAASQVITQRQAAQELDVSEWQVLRLLQKLRGRDKQLCMDCASGGLITHRRGKWNSRLHKILDKSTELSSCHPGPAGCRTTTATLSAPHPTLRQQPDRVRPSIHQATAAGNPRPRTIPTAWRLIRGIEAAHIIRKGQALGITRKNLHGQAWIFGALLGVR